MKTFKCRNCWIRNPEDYEVILNWVSRYCSKACRQSHTREKAKKEKDKVKVRKTKAKVKKTWSISVIKIKLWKIVSEYIRRRDSNKQWIWKCCTCWIKKHWKELQGGHYIPSWISSYHRYNENNIHIQCFWCNCKKHWNLIEYRPFMIKKYWLNYTEELYETRNNICKLWSIEILYLIEKYTKKLENL